MKSITGFVALAAIATAAEASPKCVEMPADLKRMVEAGQAVRALLKPEDVAVAAKSEAEVPRSLQRLQIVDRQNEDAFAAIIRRCGWPRRSDHGEDATGATWLLAQHSHPKLQKQYLPLLELAFAAHEINGSDVAYLTDWVRLSEGRKQLYGTQLIIEQPCKVSVLPIEDPAAVDARRERMKMPLLAVYMHQLRKHFTAQGCPQ